MLVLVQVSLKCGLDCDVVCWMAISMSDVQVGLECGLDCDIV